MRRRNREAAVEEAAVSAGEGVGKIDFGQTKDNEDDQRSYQNQCDDVFQNGNEAGTLDGGKEEQGHCNKCNERLMILQAGNGDGQILCQSYRVAGHCQAVDQNHPGADTAHKRVEQHGLHAVIAALHHEHGGHCQVIPVSQQHEEAANGDDQRNGAAGVGNAIAQQHEDTGADGTAKAQTNNVPEA